ncbi:MAG: 4'-phosphopantetheinyl transferase superfamily protein [Aquabacterium sp.]|nr:4'-phosphopantetheinyl transferase superfamily protein [Aquabacterium sp.]
MDVWVCRLQPTDAEGAEGADIADGSALGLDARECARARRLRSPAHRSLFVAAHAMQRMLLARHTGTLPRQLQLTADAGGKPLPLRLADGRLLHHNLAHADDWMLLAVSHDGPVGVDIEPQQSRGPLDGLARVAFSPAEHLAWSALPAAARPLAFHVGWTQKEAWLKARGLGLAAAAADDGGRVSFRLGDRPWQPPAHATHGAGDEPAGQSRLVQRHPSDGLPLVATVVVLVPRAAFRWHLAGGALLSSAG